MATIDDLADWFHARDRASWDAFAQGADSPTEDEIDTVEAGIGISLPPEVRELAQHQLGGLFIEAKEHLWPYPTAYAVGPAWSFQNGVQVFSLSSDAPDWLQMQVACNRFRATFPEHAARVPVLKRASDPALWTIDANGTLLKVYPDGAEPLEFEGGFYDLVLDEIHDLEQRLERKLAGEDQAPA